MGPGVLAVLRLGPGDLLLVRRPCLLVTLLGSCVAVTLRSPALGLAAMCHALLPTESVPPRPGERETEREVLHQDSDGNLALRGQMRYLDQALTCMVDWFQQAGGSAGLEAKAFGGADVLLPAEVGRGSPTVGHQNAEAVRVLLADLGIPLRACDLGGTQARRIFFETSTGAVFLKRIVSTTDRAGTNRGRR